MDYDLIVVKTLERVYKNYYYIIRGESLLTFVKKIRIEVFADSTSDTVISNFNFQFLQPPLTYAAAESPAKRPDGMEPCTLPPALDGSPYRLPTAISPAP